MLGVALCMRQPSCVDKKLAKDDAALKTVLTKRCNFLSRIDFLDQRNARLRWFRECDRIDASTQPSSLNQGFRETHGVSLIHQLRTLPSMALSSSPLNNTYWCIVLVSCLLVYLTKAQEFRQQELLYGQLRDGEVEYFFFPRGSVPIMDPFTWSKVGLTTRVESFPDKVTSRSGERGWTGLHTCDLATHNARFEDDEPVNQTRILRVEGGMTLEYIANVVRDGNCFDRIRRLKSLPRGDTEYADASGEIRGELNELCNRGFVALKPSRNVSVLDGPYSGDGPFKRLYLDFNNGSLRDADLSVWQISKENRMAMYYPLCDGVLSLITAVPKLPFEKVATYILMKKLRDERKQRRQTLVSREKRRGSMARPRPLTGVSNQLCGPQHVRRRLGRSDLHQWDRGLPQTFVLKRSSAFCRSFTGVSESEV